MEHPNIIQPNAANIRKLTDSVDEAIRGLKALGEDAERRDPWLIYITLNKLDNETRSLWAQQTTEEDFPTFDDFITFMGKRIDMIESLRDHTKKISPSRVIPIARTYAVAASSGVTYKCPICKQEGHRIYECDIYEKMNSRQRSETIQTNNRCFNCLNGGHRVHECRSGGRCHHCQRKHHASLHESSDAGMVVKQINQTSAQVHKIELAATKEADQTIGETEIETYTTYPQTSRTILPTTLVKIKDGNGNYQAYRALLDSASQASFISETH